MNYSSTVPPEPAGDWNQRALAIADASRLLALATLAVLGPALYALAAGRLARLAADGEQELGPVRQLLLHTSLAGLLCSLLHVLPLAQWSVGVGSLAEGACRMGRAAADALYAMQSLLLSVAVLCLLRRPHSLLLDVLLLLLWLLGAGLNFGHVHWRATAGAPYRGPLREPGATFVSASGNFDVAISAVDRGTTIEMATAPAAGSRATTDGVVTDAAEVAAAGVTSTAVAEVEGVSPDVEDVGWGSGCAEEEGRVALWRQSRVQAAAAAAPLLLALPALLLCPCEEPLRPALTVLGAVRSAACCAQLLVLALAASRPPAALLEGTAGVLRDASLLLEAALLLVLHRPARPPPQEPVRILMQDQCIGPSPPRRSRRASRTGKAGRSAPLTWQQPRSDSSPWTFSETW